MALTSPGVEVTIIDQSQYLPAPTNSVPLVVLATAQNKADPAGLGVAPATTAANAGKLYQVTSQRDLVSLYGTPFFYTTTNGTPIQGYELNEYGLLAAYSVLGASNRCYVLRADIDLASLIGQTGRPVGAPDDGTWWLDTSTSTWGIFQFNATTGLFTQQVPIVITESSYISGGVPVSSLGNIGGYAVNAIQITAYPSATTANQYFYKTTNNVWVEIGSQGWYEDTPTVQATTSNPELSTGVFSISLGEDTTITNTASISVTSGSDTIEDVAIAINDLEWGFLSAAVRSGKLCVFSSQVGDAVLGTEEVPRFVSFDFVSGVDVLAEIGIEYLDANDDPIPFYQPGFVWGTAAQQPLWYASQTYPRPTGSVFLKVGSAGLGLTPAISQYSTLSASWRAKTVTLAESDWTATPSLDATGGQLIPAGTVYGQYNFNGEYASGPVYFWERIATGPTVITGTVTDPEFNSGPYTASVYVSIPGSTSLSSAYTLSVDDNSDATDFVTAWAAAGIDYTTCVLTTDGAIQITHTEGGEIIIDDTIADGVDNGQFLTDNTTSITGTSISATGTYTGRTIVTNSGTGTGAIATVVKTGALTVYNSSNTTITITTPGSGYSVGDTVKILGSSLGGTTPANDLTFTVGTVASGSGHSNGLCATAGLVAGTTDGCKYGPSAMSTFEVTPYDTTSASGAGLILTVSSSYGTYYVDPLGIVDGGADYVVGDQVTFSGVDLGGSSTANDLTVEITAVSGGEVTAVTFVEGSPLNLYTVQLSNWRVFTYISNEGAPTIAPPNLTNWFYSVIDQVDIMINTGSVDITTGSRWKGYRNTNYDLNGFPTSGTNTTDPNGPIISATEPTTQSDGTALAYGDLWIDTGDLELYPVIYRWQSVNNGGSYEDKWVLLDNTNQTGSTGVLFQDARWATNGNTNPIDDPIPTIVSLLSSNYLDLDAPDSALYPTGMLLFNTRRSGYNVKQYNANYFNATNFPDQTLPTVQSAWVTASGNQPNGSPYMGRKAQRIMVVESLRSVVDTNTDIRDEDNYFNMIACPYYPELQPNMVVLNTDRGETGYIIGDTPMRLPDSATAIQAWATNAAGAESTGEEGCVTRNTYLGLFYPSGLTSDLSGNIVAIPPSHMMLRTFLRNDAVAYPWFAPAGTRRGIIDNATNIGYLDATTNEFVTIKTRLGIRDVLYINFINPLVFFTGNGLLNYGNKTSFNSSSALDRVNVARLIAYIRRQLTLATRPFVFEPNDALTRQQVSGVVESLMIDLVAKRGIYDYLVVCDESNNTPARIDRNELWIDVAIEPVKAAEFIYVPVRILNTGEIASL